MLRVLIVTGLLLMALGFGAAGVQYWQGLPAAPATSDASAAASPPAAAPQVWLVTATGGLVDREALAAYLTQDRFVPGRMASVVWTAPLTDLLVEGETLPAAPYLQVFADIRAPALAETLCPTLMAQLAQDCAVHAARVVEGSVDPVRGTARFRVDLAYTLKPEAEPIPDPATHVYVPTTAPFGAVAAPTEATPPDAATAEDATTEGTEAVLAPPPPATSVEAAITAAVAAGQAACASADAGLSCRLIGLSVDWEPGRAAVGEARVAWLSPLPEGMLTAPSLDPAPAED